MEHKELKDEYANLIEKLNKNLVLQIACYEDKIKQMQAADKLRIEREKPMPVVYVLKQVATNNFKIGYSTNYKKRKQLFDVKLPFDVNEWKVFETENYIQKERELHQLFAEKRLNGSEFFKLDEQDLELLETVMQEEVKDVDDSDKEDQDVCGNSPTDFSYMEDAKRYILAEGKASTSFLQRRLRIGYSRAARIMDTLEAEGFISSADGPRARRVLGNDEDVRVEDDTVIVAED